VTRTRLSLLLCPHQSGRHAPSLWGFGYETSRSLCVEEQCGFRGVGSTKQSLFLLFCFLRRRMSSSSMSLLSLPVEMLRYILHYLQQKDIAALDIASTNLSDRESFLLALDRSEFLSLSSRHKENLDCEIQWFLSRGVTVSSLTLSDRCHGQWHDHPFQNSFGRAKPNSQ
jgi:hypothetical protein